MTSKEFVLWLKGFTEGVHEYSISPKQWDTLKDKLAEVKDVPTLTLPIHTPTTHPNPYYFTTTIFGKNDITAANAHPTPTSEKQLLTENQD